MFYLTIHKNSGGCKVEEKDRNQNVDQDIEIDLSEVFNTLKENKVKYVGVITGCAAVALGFAFMQPPKYESTAVVRAKIVSAIDQLDGKKPNKDEMASYLEIMQSRSVIEPIIEKTPSLTAESGIRKNKDVAAFVKSYLKYSNPKGTDLIKITATAKTPEEAQFIAQNVMENSTDTLTNINKMGRSTHIDFLQERKNVAENEMKEAEAALETFKQDSKVFAPDSQLDSLVKQLNEVDKEITNTKTTLDIREKQMELLDDGVSASAFNVGDSTTNAVRSSLLQKQLKLQEQLQKYTEKHPDVQETKKELAELQGKVRLEARTEIAAGEVKLDALIDKKQNLEQRISKMSADKIKFVDLQRKVSTTRETYMQIVKSMEKSRIQEAMNSMDLWVIDKADLPLKTANKGKAFFIAIGAVLGAMLCLGHALWKVIRSN